MKRTTSITVTATGALALVTLVLPPVYAQRQSTASSPTSASSSPSSSAKRADPDRTSGFTLGVYTLAVPGLSISGTDVDGSFEANFGQGLGVSVDYGFNRMFSAFASLDIAKQQTGPHTFPSGDMGLSHFEIGGRLNLRTSDPNTIPYLSASLGHRSLGAYVTDDQGDSGDFTLSGNMLAAGGGIRHFFSPSFALDGGVELGYGSFNHISGNGDSSEALVNATTSIRLRAGVSWRP